MHLESPVRPIGCLKVECKRCHVELLVLPPDKRSTFLSAQNAAPVATVTVCGQCSATVRCDMLEASRDVAVLESSATVRMELPSVPVLPFLRRHSALAAANASNGVPEAIYVGFIGYATVSLDEWRRVTALNGANGGNGTAGVDNPRDWHDAVVAIGQDEITVHPLDNPDKCLQSLSVLTARMVPFGRFRSNNVIGLLNGDAPEAALLSAISPRARQEWEECIFWTLSKRRGGLESQAASTLSRSEAAFAPATMITTPPPQNASTPPAQVDLLSDVRSMRQPTSNASSFDQLMKALLNSAAEGGDNADVRSRFSTMSGVSGLSTRYPRERMGKKPSATVIDNSKIGRRKQLAEDPYSSLLTVLGDVYPELKYGRLTFRMR